MFVRSCALKWPLRSHPHSRPSPGEERREIPNVPCRTSWAGGSVGPPPRRSIGGTPKSGARVLRHVVAKWALRARVWATGAEVREGAHVEGPGPVRGTDFLKCGVAAVL